MNKINYLMIPFFALSCSNNLRLDNLQKGQGNKASFQSDENTKVLDKKKSSDVKMESVEDKFIAEDETPEPFYKKREAQQAKPDKTDDFKFSPTEIIIGRYDRPRVDPIREGCIIYPEGMLINACDIL